MTIKICLKIFLFSVYYISCSYSQNINWKKYQKIDAAIDSVITTRYETHPEDAIRGQALEAYLEPKSITKEFLTEAGLIKRIETNSVIVNYIYEDQILKSISRNNNNYSVFHNKMEDRYMLFRNDFGEISLNQEYTFDGPYIAKHYRYKQNTLTSSVKYIYDTKGQLIEEYISAMRTSHTKYNYSQNKMASSIQVVSDSILLTTLYLYDQKDIDFKMLQQENPELHKIKLEYTSKNNTTIREIFLKDQKENTFEKVTNQEEIKDDRGNVIKLETISPNLLHTVTYQYFYRDE